MNRFINYLAAKMQAENKILIDQVREWFNSRGLDHAVVGYSGGIDSATTAALLNAAKIPTTIVSINVVNQTKSSNYDVFNYAERYDFLSAIEMEIDMPSFRFDAGREAALPIMRNACLYGIVAEHRYYKSLNSIVVGTVNYDEAAFLGFWGKASDAAQDFYPISHLHKSDVKMLARDLNVPQKIINAIPSGDLQWSGDLNDLKMIGATYPQIEAVAKFVDTPRSISVTEIVSFIKNTVDDPKLFTNNIIKNKFKYSLPFQNFHVNDKLELFRRRSYTMLCCAAEAYERSEANCS
jgi:NAD+ synthase